MRNWNNFCGLVITLLLISAAGKAQQADSVIIKKEVVQRTQPGIFNKYSLLLPQQHTQTKKISANLGSPFAHWGFMCIGEYKLEQKTGIPLRLRLGSLDYVNKLEGKK